MDTASAQQLAAAIQVLAPAVEAIPPPAAPAAPAVPAANPLTSPYEGGPLELTSQHGSSLFHDGAIVLASKFTGKVNALNCSLLTSRQEPRCAIGTIQLGYPDGSHRWHKLEPSQGLWKTH